LGSASVRDNAKEVLGMLLAPLAKHVLQSGISAREVQAIWRVAVVREASIRQTTNSSRINVAGIAAATGISRSEIARILCALNSKSYISPTSKPHAINRVLAVWNSNPAFARKNGRPKQLKIYGSGQTFESLVRENGGGLPIRAVLDELLRLGSVEVIESQKVRLISAVPRNRIQSTMSFLGLAEQVSQLLESMFERMRSPESEFSISTIDGEIEAGITLPMFRKQVLSGSEDLLTDLRESFAGSAIEAAENKNQRVLHHVRVAVIYQEKEGSSECKSLQAKRRNYRRISP
jgi:hypothetical protein